MQNAQFMLIMFPNCFPDLLNVLIISTYQPPRRQQRPLIILTGKGHILCLSYHLPYSTVYAYNVNATLWRVVTYAIGSDVDRCGAWGRGLRDGFDAIDRTRWNEFKWKAIEQRHLVEKEGAIGSDEPIGGSGVGEDAAV